MQFYGQFEPPLDRLLYEEMRRHDYVPYGICIECGAADGVTESSCKLFEEEFGWLAINVEPSPPLFSRLSGNRPHALNFNLALSDRSGSADFRHAIHPTHGEIFGNGSLSHTAEHLEDLNRQGCRFESYRVNTTTYREFIAGMDLPGVDLMVLDVEGGELDVIRGMTSANHLPEFLCVEDSWTATDEIRTALETLGYRWCKKLHNNSLFAKVEGKTIESASDGGGDLVDVCTLAKQGSEENLQLINCLFSCLDDVGKVTIVHDGIELWDGVLQRVQSHPKFELIPQPVPNSLHFTMRDRAREWALNGNFMFKKALESGSGKLFFVESDISFAFDVIRQLGRDCRGVLAPAVWLGANFYDSWAFRRDGSPLDMESIRRRKDFFELLELDTAGTAMMFRTDAIGFYRLPHYYENGLIKGFTASLSRAGVALELCPYVSVVHPTSSWQKQIWHISEYWIDDRCTTLDPPVVIAGAYMEFVQPHARRINQTELQSAYSRFRFWVNRKDRSVDFGFGDAGPADDSYAVSPWFGL